MRTVCFLALFLCVAESRSAQIPLNQYVCDTWENREAGKEYCCLKSCNVNQEQPFWCYARDLQNKARYCSLPDTQTYKGVRCRDGHVCGLHGTPYSWCYTDKRGRWDYCSVEQCGTDKTCYVDSAVKVRSNKDQWAVHLYIYPVTSGRRTKRTITERFKDRHTVDDQDEWNTIRQADTSPEIRTVLERKFEETEPNRVGLRYNTFINLASEEDEERFLDASNTVPRGNPREIESGTDMGLFEVVTFEREGPRNGPGTYSQDEEKSGYKRVYVHACKREGNVDHYHRCI